MEQFYEPQFNVIEMIPTFVGFCSPNQFVTLNHEYTNDQWCSLTEAKKLAMFSNQCKLYDFVWENFVIREPKKLLKITL